MAEPEIYEWKYFLKGLKEPALSQAKELGIDGEKYCCVTERSRQKTVCIDKGQDLIFIEWNKKENKLEINKI
jgi:hypothetical protein